MGRIALISGANRGIGEAIARRLLEGGWTLSLGVRRPEALPDHLRDSDRISVHSYESADREAGNRWVAEAVHRHGAIDALINNAGISPQIGLEDGTDEALDEVFEINVKAPFRLLRAAMPHLKQSGQGRVVNISSLSGKRVMGLNAGYQMSKFAVVALTHAVRRAGWESGIRATALCPGLVDTEMSQNYPGVAPEEKTDPEDLARIVHLLLELPNTASVAELLVNCRYEHMV
jgi:NAD(P)-dependent dehydrogenase (short-subunit alcohol dehydrogenase family)